MAPEVPVHVLYSRPMKMFQKADLTTTLLHADDNWIYLKQAIRRSGKGIVEALVAGTVKSGRDRVPSNAIAAELGLTGMPRDSRAVVAALQEIEPLLSGNGD